MESDETGNRAIIFIGFVVLIAGIIIAIDNPVKIMTKPAEMGTHRVPTPWGGTYEEPYVVKPAEYETIYPFAIAGGIVCLIGVITAIIGFAMPKSKRQDIQKPMKKKKKRILDFFFRGHIWTKEVI